MKKYGKFFKKAALTAAICLGLSQSVWAMPTGGAVAEGTVSGFAANPASGAEFTVTGGPAIINWGAFGIAANESMSFNTAGGALLNQVTGGNMSQILGTLTQTGANPMFLVNPAGIIVGPGATINANQLVLSALDVDMTDVDSFSTWVMSPKFAAADGKAGTLQILGKNTKINVSAATSEYGTMTGYFVGLGKTVEVADGVTFSCADEQNYPNIDFWNISGVQLAAANSFGGSLGYESGVTTNKNNTLSFSGTANTFGQFNLQGGSVAVENANVTAAYFNAKAYSGSPYGARSFAGGVSLTDSTIKATEDAAIMGSTVDFDSTTISGMSADALIVAAKSATQNYVYDEATGTSNETQTYTMASGNKVTAKDLTISGVKGAANIYGGSVALTDSTIDVAPSNVKHDSSIRALPGLVLTGYYDVQPDFSSVTGAEKASDYKVELTNTKVTVTVKNNEIDPSIDISGGAVKLDKGTTVTLTGGDDNGINIYAVGGQSGETMTAMADNLVEVANGSKLDSRGQRIEVTAGKIAVQDGSEISGKNTYLVANDKIGFQYVEALKNTMPYGVGTKGDIAVSTDSTIPADAVIDGNKTVIDNGGGNVEPDPEPVVVNTDLPTGGKLASGGVTVNDAAWTAGDLENNSVVATKSNSIINWGTFNIEKGYGLTFNTDGGALLNRVTGGNLSSIYGTLTQKGKEPMFLVNPAGILVGGGATIDANALVLSTLSMTDNGFKDIENDKLVLGEKGSNPGPLTIEKAANVKASNHLGLLGGTVTVADDVNFDLGSELSMTAAQRTSAIIGNTAENSDYCIGAEGFRPNGIDASSSNLLSVGKNELTPNKFALLNGGAVKLQNTTIDSGVVEVRAAASGSQQGKDFVFTMGADNAISIAKATLTGNELDVIGGKVNIEGSHLTQTMVGTGSDLDIAALGEYTAFDGGDASNQPLDASHTLTLKDTTVEFKGNTKAEDKYIFMGAGQIALDNTKVTSNNGIRMSSGKVFGNAGGTADEKNTLTIANGSNVEADTWMEVMGGSIAVTGSGMSAGKDLHVAAFKTATLSATDKGNGGTNEGGAVAGGTAGVGNTVTLSGAKIDAQSIQIFGGKVDITDGSAITETNTTNKSDLTIMAAPGFVVPADGDGINPDFSNPSGAASSYAVNVKDSSVTLNTSGSTGDPSIDIGAGKVTLDNAKVTLTGGDDNGIHVFAISGTDSTGNMIATTSNSITLKNGSTLDSQGERLALVGGKITMGDGSVVSAKNDKNGALRVIASDKIGWEDTGLSTDVPVMKGSQNTIAVSEDSKILNNGVDVTDQIATTRSLIDPTNPAAPEEAATQQENIDAGKEVMDAALSNDTQAERASATENLVNNINNSTASDAAKAAQITGVMQEIVTSNLSDSEKVALQREVINTFTPTKVATNQASNVVTSATQQAGDAQPQQNQQSATVNAGSAATVPTAAEVNDTPVSIGGTDNQGGSEE